MTNNEIHIETIVDELGTWVINLDGTKDLIAPSEKYFEDRPVVEDSIPEPSQEDYMMDLDYRLSLIELGLQEV